MRWLPLLVILVLSFWKGLEIKQKHLDRIQLSFNWDTLIYLSFLGAIVFTPISINGLDIFIVPNGLGRVNLTQWSIRNIGFVENIILTIPLGILLKYHYPKKSILTVGSWGMLVSIGIETMQYVLSHLLLLNRTSDINDVLSNTIGVLLGAMVLVGYQYIRKQKTDS